MWGPCPTAPRQRAIREALTAANILRGGAVSLATGELVLYYRNNHYFAESDAIDRMVRVLSKEAPPDIEKFRLIAVHGGVPVQEFDVLRGRPNAAISRKTAHLRPLGHIARRR